MGTLLLLRLLIDFGMAILIWLVHFIIYPSFLRIESQQFVAWHKKYTHRITYIVMPLMLAQIILSILDLIGEITIYGVLSLLVLIALWALTFLVAIPVHKQLDNGKSIEAIHSLLKVNALRTILWTAELILILYACITHMDSAQLF